MKPRVLVGLGLFALATAAAAAGDGEKPGVTLDLTALRNHDLFDGAEPPLFRLQEPVPLEAPVALHFDPGAAPDAVLLRGAGAPDAPAAVEIPVGGQRAGDVWVLTAAAGGVDARDIAAEGTLLYEDGRTQPLKWMVGEQAWPAWAGATGRDAFPVALGINPSGDVVTASLLAVTTIDPAAPIRALRVSSRGNIPFAVLAVTLTAPGAVPWPRPSPDPAHLDDGYAFTPRRYPTLAPARPVATRRVVVRDGRLAFDDGAPARFWGVNLVGAGALVEPARAPTLAAHLSEAGFDLVRLHHLDSDSPGSLVNPARGKPGEPSILPDGLARLDAVFAALKARGVYTWLETWTLRSFREGEGVPAPGGVPVGNKYASFVFPEWEEAKKAHVRALWGRVNPHTGLRYADDPAIAVVELSNEDSLLVGWWGGGLDRAPGAHRAALDEAWNTWLRARYGGDARLSAAWAGRMRGGLQMGETLALGSVAREPSQRSRTEQWPTTRAADLLEFYASLEARHQGEMARFFKEELGFTAPIVCNTSFGQPAADALLAACDVVDLHIYWDPAPERQVASHGQSVVLRPEQQRLGDELSWCQRGRPCTVSELGHVWPNRHTQEAPLFWAAVGARQGWDAIAWFAWSHLGFDPAAAPVGGLDLQGRSNVLAQMPAASALWRSGAIPSAPVELARWWSPDGVARDLAESPGLLPDLFASARTAAGARLRTDYGRLPPPIPLAARDDGGGTAWGESEFTIDRPRFFAVIGRAGETSGLRVDAGSFVAASLVARDAGGALLTVVGRTERAGTRWYLDSPNVATWGEGPARNERLRGTVAFRWPTRPRSRLLDEDAAPARPVTVRPAGRGWWSIDLEGLDSPWIDVR